MLLALRAVLEGLVPVSNVAEEVDLVLVGEERSTNTVYGCVTPSFVVKATLRVEVVEELRVSLTTPEVQITDLEVAPD